MKLRKFLLYIFLVILICQIVSIPNKNLIASQNAPEDINKLESALNYYQNGEYQQAIEILEAAILSLRDNYEKGVAYNNLASSYYQIGNLSRGISEWEKAIYHFEKSSNPEAKVFLARSTLFQSQTFLELGILTNAIPKLKQIENVPDLQLRAKVKTLLGEAYLLQEDFDRAIEYYQKSLAIARLPNTKIARVKALFLRSKKLKLEANNTSDTLEAEKLNNLAAKDLQTARTEIEPLINLKEDPLTEIAARLQYFTIANYIGEAIETSAYERTKKLLDRLLNSSDKITGLIELSRYIPDRENERTLLSEAIAIAKNLDDRRNLSRAYYQLAAIYNKEKDYQKALKLNHLGLVAAESVAFKASTSDILFRLFWQRARMEQIEAAIVSYERALWNLQSNRAAYSAGYHGLLFRLREEVNPFLREYVTLLLDKNQPSRAIAVLRVLKLAEFQDYFSDPCFDLSTARDTIESDPNTATIHTFITPDRLYLILEQQNKYALRSVNIDEKELAAKLDRYVKQEIILATGDSFVTTAKELYNIFIAPIASQLSLHISTLKISSDGISRIFPWETLIDDRGKYLIEKYRVVNVPGLSGAVATVRLKEKVIFALSATELTQSSPLRYASLEAERIASVSGVRSIVVGDNFTAANLEQTIATAKISRLHLATHGTFAGTAENSYLETFSERISLNNFKNILLNAQTPLELLTLSGCETAVGNSLAPLGFAGVSVRARIPYILGSLWSIPDDLSLVKFMEDFYRAVSENKTFADAKQIAQLESIKAGENPRSWAGIILIEN